MGYMTQYRLYVVGTPSVPVSEGNEKAIRKSRDPEHEQFIGLLEQAALDRDSNPRKGVEAFLIKPGDKKRSHLEIPLAWLYDFWTGRSERAKWYDHDKDMIAFSTLFPNLVFKLTGEGEESEDIWVKYYKNGKMQHCPAKITFDPYNENELK